MKYFFLFIGLFVFHGLYSQTYGKLAVYVIAPGNFNYKQAVVHLNGEQVGALNANGTYYPTKKLSGKLMIVHPQCDTLFTKINLKKDQNLMVELHLNDGMESLLSQELNQRMLMECGEFVPTDSLDSEAQFNGNLKQFLGNEIRYPQDEIENGIDGKVYLSFIITETGEVNCITVMMGCTPSMNEESIKVVRKFPRFTPAKKNGKNVRSVYNLPITFKLA